MSIRRVVSIGSMALMIVACSEANAPTGVSHSWTQSADRSAAASQPVQTAGTFDALVDFSTVTLTPHGGNCLLTVHGQLVFHGTIEGTANGVTSALEFGPCSEVAVNPPGTFPDVFKSVAAFDGTIAGQPAHSNLLYMGRVAVGGTIDGRFVFSNGVAGALDVNSRVAVGGDYHGSVVVH